MMQKTKEGYSFFTNSGSGTWEITEDKVRMIGWKNISLSRSHVMEIAKTGDLALSKVGVQMKYFDMFGGTETLQFAMREADFRAFKGTLGK